MKQLHPLPFFFFISVQQQCNNNFSLCRLQEIEIKRHVSFQQMKYKHFLYAYKEILCQQYRLQLDCSHQTLPADVALNGVYPYLRINLEQAYWSLKYRNYYLPDWITSDFCGHFWSACMWNLEIAPSGKFFTQGGISLLQGQLPM